MPEADTPRWYLDHGASTPCREEVWDAMRPYAVSAFGNPGSLHAWGREARAALSRARESVSACINASSPDELIFTSGGTESVNLAVRGFATARQLQGRHLVTTAVEHPAVNETCTNLRQEGFEITEIGVNGDGRVTPEAVVAALRPDTTIVTVAHGIEVGTVQPLREIAEAVRRANPDVLVISDAIETVGQIPVDVRELGVDVLAFTAHKFYGPKGVGALWVKSGLKAVRQLSGGGQERGRRPGTESVPLIVGLAEALMLACRDMDANTSWLTAMRDALIRHTLDIVPDMRLNGHPVERLPGHVHFCFRDIVGEDLVLRLDALGVAASTGVTCRRGLLQVSTVLTAMGLPRDWAIGALRLTLGHACRGMDPADAATRIATAVRELRSAAAVGRKVSSLQQPVK
jgi:cysteine desulfurase